MNILKHDTNLLRENAFILESWSSWNMLTYYFDIMGRTWSGNPQGFKNLILNLSNFINFHQISLFCNLVHHTDTHLAGLLYLFCLFIASIITSHYLPYSNSSYTVCLPVLLHSLISQKTHANNELAELLNCWTSK